MHAICVYCGSPYCTCFDTDEEYERVGKKRSMQWLTMVARACCNGVDVDYRVHQTKDDAIKYLNGYVGCYAFNDHAFELYEIDILKRIDVELEEYVVDVVAKKEQRFKEKGS